MRGWVTVALATAAGLYGVVAAPGAAAQPGKSAADGIYTAAQATRGAALFTEHCAPCHGVDLTGTDFGPGLTDGELLARWRNRSVGDLFALMRSTMPLTSPGGLTASQNADLLAFILQRA